MSSALVGQTTIEASVSTSGKDDYPSSFWYASPPRNNQQAGIDDKEALFRLPSVATLDIDGPLPTDAYVRVGDLQFEPKPTCRISVSLSPRTRESDVDAADQILAMQRFTDSGLTSIHLHSMSLCRLFMSQTPKSVLQGVEVTVPLPLSSITSSGSCRRLVKEMLSQCGADALDNVQLVCDQARSFYFLDALDELHDLQRQGLVRSVSARDMAGDQIRRAAECGFPLSSNAVPGNIFQQLPPDQLLPQRGKAASEKTRTPPTLVTSPLGGGFLTGRYLGRRLPSDVRGFESCPSIAALRSWGQIRARAHGREAMSDVMLWNAYQRSLNTLNEVARHYYGVDIATIALRWLLQHGLSQQQSVPIVSAVVSSRLPPSNGFLNRGDAGGDTLESRIRSLRRVFSFELCEEDMNQILDLSSWNARHDTSEPQSPLHPEPDGRLREQQLSQNDIETDSKYRKLWL